MAILAELLFFLLPFAVLVQAQTGFISIDCGIPEGSNYTDVETGIFYTSDVDFIHSGENREFPSSNSVAASLKRQLRTMRSFPEGGRNCYTVRPVQKGSRYFLRASFMYVDYEEVQEAPEFDLYVGINLWTTVSLTNASLPGWITEIVVVATRDFIPVCLVNTGKGSPFISALEARLVKSSMYTQASYNQSLLAKWLYDAGSTSGKIIRYPDDDYDRLWEPYLDPSWASISTSLTVDNIYLGFEPPSTVMQTAATPLNANDSLYFYWTANNHSTEFHVFRHFADFQKSNGSATLRQIDCCNNGRSCFPHAPEYLVSSTVYTTSPMTGDSNYSVSFSKTEKSALPPILNALEIYEVLNLNEIATDEQDVRAIMSMKDIYGLQKNWMGDPCLPNTYLWDGLTCSNDSDADRPPRIISLNLSSSGLTGSIDVSFGNLNLIQTLDLSKNNLTGPIPSFLAKLTSLDYLDLSDNNLTGTVPQVLGTLIYLSYLNLSHNQLSGSVPTSLVDKSRTGSLTLSVDPSLCNSASCNDTDTCALKSCKKSRKSIVVPVVIAVVVAAVLAIGVAGLIWYKRRPTRGLEYLHVGCRPPIVHRDVKAANILLNETLEAKLADFGICKVFPDEYHTHISTQVKGTHGYLDPEYFSYNNLTEKSDVYSYGVVLLELVTGRPAITQTQDSQKTGLVQWVAPFLLAGDIWSIVDPKLHSDYNVASAWRVLDLAISCTQPRSVQRPSMSSLVAQLKECLEVETCTGGSMGVVVAEEFATGSSSTSLYSPIPR